MFHPLSSANHEGKDLDSFFEDYFCPFFKNISNKEYVLNFVAYLLTKYHQLKPVVIKYFVPLVSKSDTQGNPLFTKFVQKCHEDEQQESQKIQETTEGNDYMQNFQISDYIFTTEFLK